MDWMWVLFSIRGRISREPFLVFTAFALALVIVPAIMVFEDPLQEGQTYRLVIGILLFWPSIAVQAKRWHDLDKSAWWILVNLIPAGGLVALLVLAFAPGTPGANRYGPQANTGTGVARESSKPFEHET